MSRERVPLGAERKDAPWRWASLLVGLLLLLALLDLFSGGRVSLIGLDWRLFAIVAIALLLSAHAGLAWLRGEPPAPRRRRTEVPPVEIQGKEGSTYVLLGAGGRSVRPKELGPGGWVLYSVLVRAPVAAGDYVLTYLWRLVGRVSGVNGGPRLPDAHGHSGGERDAPGEPETF